MDAILGLQQHLGQHADAANASMQYAHNNPSLGSVAGSFKDTVLGTLLGVPMEAFGAVAKATAGELAYPIAAAQTAGAEHNLPGFDPNSTATAAARQIVAGGSPLNPGGVIDAARTSPDIGVSGLAGLLEMAANPLNYAGGIGQAGRGLAEGAPLAGRAIAGLGDAMHGFNEIAGAPLGMLTRGGRARLGGMLDQLAAPGAQATPALTTDLPRLAAQYAGTGDRLAEAVARDNAIAQTGLDPTTVLGSKALPNGYKVPAGPTIPDAPDPLNLPSVIGKLSDYNQAARQSGYPTLSNTPIEDSPLVMKNFSPFLAAKQLAARGAADTSAIAETAPLDAALQQALPDLPRAPELGAPRGYPTPAPAPLNDRVAELMQRLRPVAPPLDTTATAPLGAALQAADKRFTTYGPDTIYPGEGVTPDALKPFDSLSKLAPSTTDINAEIGALRDPVTMMQDAYGADWQRRLSALTGGTWGAQDGASLVNGRIMRGGVDLTTAVRDYMEARGGPAADAAKAAIKALLPDATQTADSGIASALAPVADTATGLGSSAPNSPMAHTGTLDDMRNLILGERDRVGTVYPPNDPAFYQGRANIDPAHVPGMLRQLADEGTLGFDPNTGYAVKPGATNDAAPLAQQLASRTAGAAPADGQLGDIIAGGLDPAAAARLPGATTPAADLPSVSEALNAPTATPSTPLSFGGAKYTSIMDTPLTAKAQEAAPLALQMQYGGLADGEVARLKAQAAGQTSIFDAQQPAAVSAERDIPGLDGGELFKGIADAVKRGAVDEANALVQMAPDFGIPTTRAQTYLNTLADGADTGATTEAQAILDGPYGAAFKYFNERGNLKQINARDGGRTNVRGPDGKVLRQGDMSVSDVAAKGNYDTIAANLQQNYAGADYNPATAQNADEFFHAASAQFQRYKELTGGLQARGAQAKADLFGDAADLPSAPSAPSALAQITSSIKNPGLLGFPGGLPSPAVTRALIGGGIGGIGGGATGLADGLLAGDSPDQLKHDTTTAALAGVAVGAGTGASLPQLQSATQTALTAIAQHAPTMLNDTIASPEIQAIAIKRGIANQTASQGIKGAKFGELLSALDNLWRGQTTQTAKNLTQDAGTIRLLVSQFGDEFATDQGAVKATLGELARNLDNPDPIAQAGTLGQTFKALGQDRLLIPTSASDTENGLHNLVGVDMVSNTTNKGTALNAPQRIAAGMGIGAANAVLRVSPLSLVAGGARAYFAPFADSYFGTLNGLQHDAPRVAFLQGALDRDLPKLASDFLGDLGAQGLSVKPLEALGGKFDGATLRAEIAQAGGGAQLADTAAKEWDTLTETLIRSRADRIAHLFGDFRDAAQTGMGGTAVKGIGRVFPFATWALKYAPVLAEIAAKHPRVTAGILGAELNDAAQAKQDGRPAWQVGTIPVSTETPLIGGAVRARLGGESGTMRLNPLSLISPYGGQTVSSLGDTSLDSATTPYEHAMNYANLIGLSPHPLIQAGAYITGQDYKGPSSMSRTAGLEQLPQALPAIFGHNAVTDTLASTMPSAQNTLDAARKLISGQGSTATDPIARRYDELVLANTGRILQDPSNRAYLNMSSPAAIKLHDQAMREAVLSGAASNAYSFTAPMSATAQSTEAESAAKVRGAVTQLQNSAVHQAPLEAAATQEAIRRYQDQHPESLVYQGATKQGLAALRLADWERQNMGLREVPLLYNYQKNIVMEQLGLLPPGTYANMIRSYELKQRQPGQFTPTLLPGVPMPTQQPLQLPTYGR